MLLPHFDQPPRLLIGITQDRLHVGDRREGAADSAFPDAVDIGIRLQLVGARVLELLEERRQQRLALEAWVVVERGAHRIAAHLLLHAQCIAVRNRPFHEIERGLAVRSALWHTQPAALDRRARCHYANIAQ
jgi:hypothetical protein